MAAGPNNTEPSEPSRRELAELSALADGTLDPAREAAVRRRIGDSAELSALYQRERRVVDLARAAAMRTRAPSALRARVTAERQARTRALLRPVNLALAAGLALVLLVVVLVLPAATPGSPTLSQAAALALRGPTAPASAVNRGAASGYPGQAAQQISFPESMLGWSATGQRVDHLAGHLAVTVYYRQGRREVAYTILAAPALTQPRVTLTTVNGTELHQLRLGRRRVVSWLRAGETCVLSAAGVSTAELQNVAASTLGD